MVAPTQTAACSTKAGPARLLRRLFGNQRGSISIIAAASLPVLLGFGALAVDASLWLRAKNAVQGAADDAASSAAAAAFAGNSPTRVSAEPNGVAAANGYQNGQNGVVVTLNHPPLSGAYTDPIKYNAYEVIISAPQQLYLASVLPALTAPTVTGRAVALIATPPACILALSSESTSNGSLAVNGNTPLIANQCDVDADSPSNKSINTSGGGSISAANIRTVGEVSGNNITVTGTITTDGPNIRDPYATTRSIPPGPWPVNPQNKWSGPIHNPTGVVAFQGDVTVAGDTTLDPGVYIIITGGLNSSKLITGTGVTIILTSPTPSTDNGTFGFTGSGSINLKAPTTGTTAGIVLWADGRLPYHEDKFAGGSTSDVVGAIYLPSHLATYGGNAGAGSPCTQLIAYQITITGTSTFNHQCDGRGMLDPMVNWSLVE